MNIYTGYLLYMLTGMSVSMGAYIYYNYPMFSMIKNNIYGFFYPSITTVFFTKLKVDEITDDINEDSHDNLKKEKVVHKPIAALKKSKNKRKMEDTSLAKTSNKDKTTVSFKIREIPYQCIYFDTTSRETTIVPIPKIFDIRAMIERDTVSLAFIKKNIQGKERYLRVKELGHIKEYDTFSDISFCVVDPPFLQIEIEHGDEKMNIHYDMDKFYLHGNCILDYDFLQWYMKYWYSINIDNDDKYYIRLIDKNVKIISITKNHKINIGENGYKIENI